MLPGSCDAPAVALVDSPDAAWQLARSLLADLRLYGGGPAELDEARCLFRARVAPPLYGIFEAALAQEPARGVAAASPAAVAPDGGRRPRAVLVVMAVVAAVGGGLLLREVLARSGDEVGVATVPGALGLDAQAGDRLSITVDSDVLFAGEGRRATPQGCQLELVALRGAQELGRASCDPFANDAAVSIAGSTTYSVDQETGLRRLRTSGQRVACQLGLSEAGPVTLQVGGNLPTCVPRFLAGLVHVTRLRAR